MAVRRISPPLEALAELRTPLTPGERLLFEILDGQLETEWEIYVQPHLNGLRPDFVLLHPRNGVCILEVKDWDFISGSRFVDAAGEMRVRVAGGSTTGVAEVNPVRKVLAYKDALQDLYCPRLQGRPGLRCISAGVVLAQARRETADGLREILRRAGRASFLDQYPISTQEDLEQRDIQAIFPRAERSWAEMSDDVLSDLRHWLVEPEFSAEQRRRPAMDEDQRRLATTRTVTGYRRIRGSAGSGKSLVLAARAAQLCDDGKEVLVVTFNITLLNYLRDLFSRLAVEKGSHERVTWLNFHALCKWLAIEADSSEEYRGLWAGLDGSTAEVLETGLAAWTESLIRSADAARVPRFDAILVDEGQDFHLSWWKTLRALSSKHERRSQPEMLLIADATQDLYKRARAWTESAMLGAGFAGDWSRLDVSYRMPALLVPLVRDFAERYLPQDELTNLPEASQLELVPFDAAWCQVTEGTEAHGCLEAIRRGLIASGDADPLVFADLVILAASNKLGSAAVKVLRSHGIEVESTFLDEDQVAASGSRSGSEARNRKRWFYKGDARVKATTIQSFKGWESRFIVILIDPSTTPAQVYTAMTRVRRSDRGSQLHVISSSERFVDAGRKWPGYQDLRSGGENSHAVT